MLSSHYHHHKSKTFSQLTQCPFTGTLLLFKIQKLVPTKTSTGTVTQPAEAFTGTSPVQATGDVAASTRATQPVEAASTKRAVAASMTATRPVEAPGTVRVTTQLPVEAPGARSEVHSQPTGTSSVDVSDVDWSLTSKGNGAADNTGVSDSEDELNSELESPALVSDQEVLSGTRTGTYPRTTGLTRSSLKRQTTERQ